MYAGASYSTSPIVEKLDTGNFPLVSEKVTVTSATAGYASGSVMGQVTIGLRCKLSASAASDGSQTPYAVLADDIPPGAAECEAMVYLAGEFPAAKLTFGAGHTAASAKAGLRQRGIYLQGA